MKSDELDSATTKCNAVSFLMFKLTCSFESSIRGPGLSAQYSSCSNVPVLNPQ